MSKGQLTQIRQDRIFAVLLNISWIFNIKMMTQDKAKIGLETVTERSQNNKLVDGFLTTDMANIGQITLTKRGQSNQIKKKMTKT